MTYPDVMPHGELEELFPNVFFVTGTSRPTFMNTKWQFSRNMVVVRDGGELTIINSVRLDDAGLRALDALGRVRHVVKIGAFHGFDDAFYRDHYDARHWALAEMTHDDDRKTDEILATDHTPIGASLFRWSSPIAEAVLLLPLSGGILVACDSMQNWVTSDAFFDASSSEKLAAAGFLGPAKIGAGWRTAAAPTKEDFARLRALRYQHFLSAHGRPMKDDAKAQWDVTLARELAS